MMMRMRWLAVLIAGVLGTATAAAQERSPVVVIAIDGLRPDYVLEPARHGRPIPHLAGFVARGAWAEGVVGVVPTVTYPSFTTVLTGVIVALASLVGDAAETYDLTNIGTLFAFTLVCAGVLVLRVKEPERPRPFKVPFVWVIAPLGMAACLFVMAGLPRQAWERFGLWLAIGTVIYLGYGFRHSKLRRV